MVQTRSQRRNEAETKPDCQHTKKSSHMKKKKIRQGQFDIDAVSKPSLAVGIVACAGIVAAIVKGDVADNETLFITLAACMLATIFVAVPAIPQDLEYHNFADQRTLTLCGCGSGVPNSADVLSNIPFFIVGLSGLDILYNLDIFPMGDILPGNPTIKSQSEHEAWCVFFIGILLVSFGSGYYHWYRTNETLIWDRLPMTIGFMSIFVIQCVERLGPHCSTMLYPLTILGAFSVYWWHFSQDLRLYVFVQFFPLISMPILVAGFPAQYTRGDLPLVALGFYIACKIVELKDREIFTLTGKIVSGHTLKHLLAAVSPAVAIYYLCVRKVIQ